MSQILKMPNWLKEREIEMDDNEKIEPPMVATIPLANRGGIYSPPDGGEKPAAPTIGSGVEKPAFEPTTDAQADTILRAAAYRAEAEATYKAIIEERQKMQITLAEQTLTLESRNRQINDLELELAETRNNMQVVQAQCEDMRQACADIRAFQSEHMAQLKHMIVRHENFEIPLPIRAKLKRNGNGNHKKAEK